MVVVHSPFLTRKQVIMESKEKKVVLALVNANAKREPKKKRVAKK
jgi:hypothetical protein